MATRTAAGGTSYFTYSSPVTNGLSAITVVALIKSDSTSTDRGFFHTQAAGITAGSDNAVSCRYDSSGAGGGGSNLLKMAVQHSLPATQQLESSNNSQTTGFQSVIFHWASGEQIALYLDGVQDTPTSNSAGSSGTTTNAAEVWMHRGAKDNANAWNGVVYELRIYNRKLAENEIISIANMNGADGIKDGLILHWHGEGAPGTTAGSIVDRSGNGYTGTAGGTTTPTYEEDDRVQMRRRRAA